MGVRWQTVRFDRDLVRRYDVPGPRYTSYPTAPQFREQFGAEGMARLLCASARSPLPLSLYVHIPFCEKRCFFCGCNVAIARDRSRGKSYLRLLDRELEMASGLLDAPARRVIQIHWGGGTPNFLPPEDLSELMALTRRHFRLAPGCEIGVEVDPRYCSDEHLDALADAGCNRLSLGVQDLDPGVQAAVNRVQPAERNREVIEGARRRGIKSLNLDLIYGLPHQTPQSFAATVDEIVRLGPDRLAIFNFAYLPSMFKHQRVIDPATLPDPDSKLTILERTIEQLTAAGYVFIGMDHFARPDDPLSLALRERTLTRNFQGYSTGGDTDLVGLGASAISQVCGGYAQNVRTIPEYGAAIEAGRFATSRGLDLAPEDLLRREVIMRIMCDFRLVWAPIEERHRIDFRRHFATELERLRPLADDGLIELGSGGFEVTPLGRLLVRNVAMLFDAYLDGGDASRYSRTV